MRGLWRCRTSDGRIMKENYQRKWMKTGKWLVPIDEGCGNWNVYRSVRGKGVAFCSTWVIDTRCKKCSRRVKFQVYRQDNRGTVSPVHFSRRPDHMPTPALIEECRARNRRVLLDREIDGFMKASDLPRGGKLE